MRSSVLHTVCRFFAYFWRFGANFATSKKLSKNQSVHIILIPDATLVPNLTFLDLGPEISFGGKTVTQKPSLFRHL